MNSYESNSVRGEAEALKKRYIPEVTAAIKLSLETFGVEQDG